MALSWLRYRSYYESLAIRNQIEVNSFVRSALNIFFLVDETLSDSMTARSVYPYAVYVHTYTYVCTRGYSCEKSWRILVEQCGDGERRTARNEGKLYFFTKDKAKQKKERKEKDRDTEFGEI